MASINGIEIKAVTSRVDNEGMMAYSGNVYLNGKKVGAWSQSDYGAPDNFYSTLVDYNKLDEAVRKRHDPIAYMGYQLSYNFEILASDLLHLRDYEKMYKKYVKEGYTRMAVVDDGRETHYIGMPKTYTQAQVSGYIQKQKSEGKTVKYFDSIEQFNEGEKIPFKEVAK